MRRATGCTLLGALALAVLPSSPTVASSAPVARVARVAHAIEHAGPATVAVAVATLWRSPGSPRAVDAPALANPVRVRDWLDAMTVTQRRRLSGRADTQVLLGDEVRVLALSGGWARVVVPDQPSPRDARGYPGWVPVRQLVAGTTRPTSLGTVTVTTPRAWLRDGTGERLMRVSFGTRLAATGRSGNSWQVRLPDGRAARIKDTRVATKPRSPTKSSLVATARLFLGLDYLWAGASGFGFDCSGLMAAVYRSHGIVIPRDTTAQVLAGRAVRRSDLKRGDLVFFARNGRVHHVGMYAGGGLMLHAPHTGTPVQLTPLSAAPFGQEYAGARRFRP